jgi:hypothetical protein
MLNKVLVDLECMLLRTDSEYKLTKDQRNNWIKYAVTKEFTLGMPWEDVEEKKKKQGNNNACLAYVLQVYQLDYKQIRTLYQIVKQRKLWLQHWGNAAFTGKQQPTRGEDTLHPDGPDTWLGPVESWGSINQWGHQCSFVFHSLTHAGFGWNSKGTNQLFSKGCLLNDGGGW